MKEKEEDEERNEKICPQRTDRQSNKQRTKPEFKNWGHSNPLWIVGERANKDKIPGPKIGPKIILSLECKIINLYIHKIYGKLVNSSLLYKLVKKNLLTDKQKF